VLYSIVWNNARNDGHAQGRSRSLKVIDFGSDRKLVCDFLLMNITNLYPSSTLVCRFSVHNLFHYTKPFTHHMDHYSPVWQTDRQTDGQTERTTLAIACASKPGPTRNACQPANWMHATACSLDAGYIRSQPAACMQAAACIQPYAGCIRRWNAGWMHPYSGVPARRCALKL